MTSPVPERGTSDGPRASASTFIARASRFAPAVGVLIIGVLSAYLWDLREAALAQRRAQAAFEKRANEISQTIALAFEAPLQSLHDFAGVLETFPELDEATFQRYALHLAREDPSLAGVHWLPIVAQQDRTAFEQTNGCAILDRMGGKAQPAPTRTRYLPVAMSAPWEDRSLWGHDRLGPGGDNALLKASDNGLAVATKLPSTEVAEPTIALVQAVCGPRHDAEPCRSTRVRGLVELWIRVGPVVNEAVRHLDAEELVISLDDLSAPPGEHALYTSAASPPKGPQAARLSTRGVRADMRIADRWWQVVVTPDVRTVSPVRSSATLVRGVSFAALLALLIAGARMLRTLRSKLQIAKQLGQYVLERQIGDGSTGTVYLARHSMLRRPTALKLLKAEHLGADALRRFEREVQLTSILCHPNTISIYDFGHTREGVFYYAMEYLDGLSLQTLVELDGRQPPNRVVHVLLQACGALEEAHAVGLIHRDVKPANMMLCVRGVLFDFLKLLDFGLVKDLRDPGLLARNTFVGTPLYAAPEAYLMPDEMDARADLYSLGAVAFFLLTGREVFQGVHVIDVLEAHASLSAPSFGEVGVHDVPEELEAVVHSCLAKDPKDRPTSARVLRRQLEQLVAKLTWTDDQATDWWLRHALRGRINGVAVEMELEKGRASLALGATVIEPIRRSAQPCAAASGKTRPARRLLADP